MKRKQKEFFFSVRDVNEEVIDIIQLLSDKLANKIKPIYFYYLSKSIESLYRAF
jgi:L-lysine 2,3-aminomutase